ncbi:MAG: glycosyltransferase family 4 protein, partial [Candidatus Omnitrophica bacterium]|nr:glycosyltransferase family 4 protein [Candidatus Omnitrophota bacterium]
HDGRYADPVFLRSRGANPDQFKLAKQLNRFSDKVLVLTKTNEDYMREKHLCAMNKVERLLNGIPLSQNGIRKAEDIFVRYPQLRERKIIFMAARLAEGKNLELIFELAAQLKDDFPEILFLVAGDGPLMEKLKIESKQKDLEKHILFIGFYTPVKELLNISDVVIHPSLMELHSITVIEALSMEKPVLVSQHVGCHDEWFTHRKNAFLLDPYQPQQWSVVIRELLEDDFLSKEISKKGRLLAEQTCDIKKVVNRIQNLYKELTTK